MDLLVEGGADEAPVVLRRAYAHSDGRYVIASPPAGTYTLVVFEGEDGAWVERTRVEVAVAGSGVEELDLIDLAIEPDGA